MIHTVWNLLFSCNDVKWTSFGVIKYRLHHHFSGCGGAEMEVERNGEVVRIRVISRSHYLFIRKDAFYISVMQHQFLWFQINHIKISTSHSCISAYLYNYYLGSNSPPPLKINVLLRNIACWPAESGLGCKNRATLLGILGVSCVEMSVCVRVCVCVCARVHVFSG